MASNDQLADPRPGLAAAGTAVGGNAGPDAALRESEARHRLLIDSWAQALWETDPDGVVVADSPSWRAYTGQTLEEWLGYGWLNAIHPDDRAYAERQWREATTARRPVDAEFRLRAPDGGWRWTNVRAAPVLDAEGRIEKWAGMNVDIDARKRAEESLRESEVIFRTVFDSIDEGFCIVETIRNGSGTLVDLEYREANRAYARQAGFQPHPGLRVKDVAPGIETDWMDFYDRASLTGAPEIKESFNADLNRWFRTQVTRVGPAGSPLLGIVFEDVTERKGAEIALKESEERQAFLLGLSDALRPLSEPAELMATASAMLGSHLRVGRCGYGEVTSSGDALVIERDWTDGIMPSLQGTLRLADFGDAFISAYRAGQTVVLDDVYSDARGDGVERAFEEIGGLRASLAVPLVKNGRWTAVFYVQQSSPRRWTRNDEELVRDIAERTWAALERARAEAALRESEERFAQFAGAASGGIWIRDAETLAMEYASPAVGAIYGAEPSEVGGSVERWAAMIVPDDRAVALEHIRRVRQGEAVVHEFRIQRASDHAFRWIRDTGFPLALKGRVQRIGGIAEDITEAKLAIEHQSMLLAELQHRVRNIMALIRSITARTGERAASVQDYTELMLGRLQAFARVQTLLTRAANVSVGIASIVHDEVSVQAQHERQYALDGPDVELSPKAAEVLTLAVHELATNAVKYGALSVPNGTVTVTWSTFEKRDAIWLAFDWIEAGAPPRSRPANEGPRRRGFGSDLIEGRVPYELNGKGTIAIEPGGARCHLEFPLQGGASILETGAPRQATVFGGTIDMTGQPDLSGSCILVVEDDYYLATDAARALQGAGAQVMGPCGSEADARAELGKQRPDAVILDINLGQGATFKLAEYLKDRGIPFVFTTGYDQEVIPAEFDTIQRMEKPFQLRQVVGAAARLMGEAA